MRSGPDLIHDFFRLTRYKVFTLGLAGTCSRDSAGLSSICPGSPLPGLISPLAAGIAGIPRAYRWQANLTHSFAKYAARLSGVCEVIYAA